MANIKGNDVIISFGGKANWASKSCDIEESCDVIEIASPNQGTDREYITDRKSGRITMTKLVSSVAGDMLVVGNSYTLTVSLRGVGTEFTCSAICTQAKVTATRGSLAQGYFSFLVNGGLTIPSVASEEDLES